MVRAQSCLSVRGIAHCYMKDDKELQLEDAQREETEAIRYNFKVDYKKEAERNQARLNFWILCIVSEELQSEIDCASFTKKAEVRRKNLA